MHILIVTFQLNGLSAEAYERLAADSAPAFAALPGLVSKLWLADLVAGTYGGVYVWESRAALERYLESPIFGSLATNPFLANVDTRVFDTIAGANGLTAGPLAAAMYANA